MRLRSWIGLTAVALIAIGSVVAALTVHAGDERAFHRMQDDEALRAARQTEAVAALSVGQLSSAAAFYQATGHLSQHQFDVVGRALLRQGVLRGTAYIPRVPGRERARYERAHGFQITEPWRFLRPKRATRHPVYFPLTYVIGGDAARALGFDLAADPTRAPYLRRARDTGKPVASPVTSLLLGGVGIVVYKAVYRDGAPTRTVAERRAALVGYSAGSITVDDLAKAAAGVVPGVSAVQLRAEQRRVAGVRGPLEDASRAPVTIADRSWLLVVRDPNRPDVSLPLLLAIVGIAASALLAALIVVWTRNERVQELERQATQDSLTGLHNRRRFEEDLRAAMARSSRDGTTGALLMVDLDDFKQVNDTYGHPAGDRLIREIAGVLRRRTRESDSLARLGGDEFAVILPRCSRTEAQLVAEAITGSIRTHRPEDGAVRPITASVGVAIFDGDGDKTPPSVVAEADAAMYAAKDGGRDGIRIFAGGGVKSLRPSAAPTPPAG
jgi:diguanylate cyclase (GGDEF)-like protein